MAEFEATAIERVANVLREARGDGRRVLVAHYKTAKQLAEAAGLSIETTREALRALQEGDDLKRTTLGSPTPVYRWRNEHDRNAANAVALAKWQQDFLREVLDPDDPDDPEGENRPDDIYVAEDDGRPGFRFGAAVLARLVSEDGGALREQVRLVLTADPDSAPCAGKEHAERGEGWSSLWVWHGANEAGGAPYCGRCYAREEWVAAAVALVGKGEPMHRRGLRLSDLKPAPAPSPIPNEL